MTAGCSRYTQLRSKNTDEKYPLLITATIQLRPDTIHTIVQRAKDLPIPSKKRQKTQHTQRPT